MVKFSKLDPNAVIPVRKTLLAAGYDMSANECYIILPHAIALVGTGITATLEDDQWIDLRIRSSLALSGLMLMNGAGVVDADYAGNEIKFMLYNASDKPVAIEAYQRIGQAIISTYHKVDDDHLYQADVRISGFGSTGDK